MSFHRDPVFLHSFWASECIFIAIFPTQYVYLDPYVYCFFQIFHPVRLFGPIRLFGTLKYLHDYLEVENHSQECDYFIAGSIEATSNSEMYAKLKRA